MADIKSMTDWKKLEELLAKQKKGKSFKIDPQAFIQHLKNRVKGQEAILEGAAEMIRLNFAKERRGKPICNLMFLGPTGTGKTELAKAICEYLYEDEKNLLRFDCSELSNPEVAKARLVGMPLGYVGAEQGGQLTRPIFSNPRRVILFDEIEKAHPIVFDLFLQLMGEGRLTEQSTGRTADYTQSIVIFTSNAQAEQISQIYSQTNDPIEALNAVKSTLADAQVFRPELLGRIDRISVFKPLEADTMAEIALQKTGKLAKEYGLNVEFVAPELIIQALVANEKISRFGVRELERILFDMFAHRMTAEAEKGTKDIRISVNKEGQIQVIGAQKLPKAA